MRTPAGCDEAEGTRTPLSPKGAGDSGLQPVRGPSVGRTPLSSRRSTSIASRSPAQRLASAASGSCNSDSDRNVARASLPE
jgi:hypothetical protein